jgi:transcriptional regulator with XRE-family HTH domain
LIREKNFLTFKRRISQRDPERIKLMTNKPFYDTSREYENRINEYRVEDGYSLPELAKKAKMGKGTLHQLCQGMGNPIDKKGKLKDYILRLCTIFNVEFAELFPFEMCLIRKDEETPKLEDGQVHDITISHYTMTSHTYEDLDLAKAMMDVLDTLVNIDKRMKDVLIMRFYYDMTLEDVCIEYNVNPERIRQIESKALRLIRHPSRSHMIKMFISKKYISREFHRRIDGVYNESEYDEI